MNRTIIDLPCGMFGPLEADWFINPRGRSAGETVDGGGQVIYGVQPRWEASLTLSNFGRDRVLTWRAIRARMRGRINVLRICVCDRWRPKLTGESVPHSDGSYFSDGTGYGYVPTLVIPFGADAGEDEILVNATPIDDLMQPGHWFSHNDWPYQVVGLSGTLTERTYQFEPPLRRAITAGDEIRVGEATALMAFQDDSQGRVSLALGKHGDAQINLVEWTNRP